MNRTLGAAISACLALVGCVAPTQYGGPIAINPVGVEARIAWVCGLGQSNPDVSAFCFAEAPAASSASNVEPGPVESASQPAAAAEPSDQPAPSLERLAPEPPAGAEPPTELPDQRR